MNRAILVQDERMKLQRKRAEDYFVLIKGICPDQITSKMDVNESDIGVTNNVITSIEESNNCSGEIFYGNENYLNTDLKGGENETNSMPSLASVVTFQVGKNWQTDANNDFTTDHENIGNEHTNEEIHTIVSSQLVNDEMEPIPQSVKDANLHQENFPSGFSGSLEVTSGNNPKDEDDENDNQADAEVRAILSADDEQNQYVSQDRSNIVEGRNNKVNDVILAESQVDNLDMSTSHAPHHVHFARNEFDDDHPHRKLPSPPPPPDLSDIPIRHSHEEVDKDGAVTDLLPPHLDNSHPHVHFSVENAEILPPNQSDTENNKNDNNIVDKVSDKCVSALDCTKTDQTDDNPASERLDDNRAPSVSDFKLDKLNTPAITETTRTIDSLDTAGENKNGHSLHVHIIADFVEDRAHRKLHSPPPPPESADILIKHSHSEPLESGTLAEDASPTNDDNLPRVHFALENTVTQTQSNKEHDCTEGKEGSDTLEPPIEPAMTSVDSIASADNDEGTSGSRSDGVASSSHRDSGRVSFAYPIIILNSDDDSLSSHDDEDSSVVMTPSTIKNLISADLRGNLMATVKDRDPLLTYELVKVIGVGSMGNVAKVRKRPRVVETSAQIASQEEISTPQSSYLPETSDNTDQPCFRIPVVGRFFQSCFEGLITRQKDPLETKDPVSEKDSHDQNAILNDSIHSASSDEGELATSRRKDEALYAMKSIHLSRVTEERFIEELKNEVEILKSLDHPHIVRAIETYEYQKQLFVIMELCDGGDLYSRDPYTEDEAARICSSVLSAIAYMHSRGILHRDLKFENVLFATTHPRSEVKLIDFGLSKIFGNEELTEGVGTIYTMAPEVLKGSYTKQADLWSVGVIAFMLLSSQMPFYGRKRSQIMEQIMEGKVEFKGRKWKRVSRQAKAFVEDLLVVDPDERVTAEEALQSQWLNRYYNMTVRKIAPNTATNELADIEDTLSRYVDYSKLRKVALMVIAHKSTSDEIGLLRKMFQKYDTVRTGQVEYDQFKAAMSQAGFSDDSVRKIFDAVDIDGSGKIRYTEFLAATIEARGAISEMRLAEAFERLDCDGTGYISADNLREILGPDFPQEEIDEILREASKSGDGKVSYPEFLALWEDHNDRDFSEAVTELKSLQGTEGRNKTPKKDDRYVTRSLDLAGARASFISQKNSIRSFVKD